MNAKEFAWSYLIKNGWSFFDKGYHGGYYIKDESVLEKEPVIKELFDELSNVCYHPTKSVLVLEKINQKALELIHIHGIDWSLTNNVQSDIHSKVSDTYSDPDTSEILNGELVLNNGLKIFYSCEKEVLDVFQIMENVSILTHFFNENLSNNVVITKKIKP